MKPETKLTLWFLLAMTVGVVVIILLGVATADESGCVPPSRTLRAVPEPTIEPWAEPTPLPGTQRARRRIEP